MPTAINHSSICESWLSMEPVFQVVMPCYRSGDPAAVDARQPQWEHMHRFLCREAGAFLRRSPRSSFSIGAEDAVQEWHRTMWTGAAQAWDPDRPFAPWGRAILKHICLRHAAQDQRLLTLQFMLEPTEPGNGFSKFDDEAQQRMILTALSKLSSFHRELILGRFWNDLPGTRMADVLGCSSSKVSRQLHKALELLRASLMVLEPD